MEPQDVTLGYKNPANNKATPYLGTVLLSMSKVELGHIVSTLANYYKKKKPTNNAAVQISHVPIFPLNAKYSKIYSHFLYIP